MDVLAGLWEEFRGTILGRVAVLEGADLALRNGGMDEDMRLNSEREAHKLAGSVALSGSTEERSWPGRPSTYYSWGPVWDRSRRPACLNW